MNKSSARLRLLCLALAAVLPGCFLRHKHEANLLVIVVDSLRSDVLSDSIGAPEMQNLVTLANDGVEFRKCYAHSSATLPAHAAILGARVPHSMGVYNDVQPIDAQVPLLTEHLRARGWRTFGVVSTQDLVPPGLNQGIDRGCETFRAPEPQPASAAQVNAELMTFLETADADKPWFAYADYSDPAASADVARGKDVSARVLLDGAPIGTARAHDEGTWSVEIDLTPGKHRFEMRSDATFNLRTFQAGSERARFLPTFEVGALFTPLSRVVVAIVNDQDSVVTCRFEARIRAVQTLAESRGRYKDQVEAVDRAIGQVTAALKSSGRYDDTIIVVTGSHGESLGEHGSTGHDITLYDEVLRVPLVIKPVKDDDRRAEMGRRQFDLVRQIDIAPTLLDLLDEPALPGAEGFTLLQGGMRELMAESHPPESPGTILAFRDDRYKLVYDALADRFEMYDVKGDTLEMDNLFELHGHFRSQWQLDLRALARNVPQAPGFRIGAGPKVDLHADAKAPSAARN